MRRYLLLLPLLLAACGFHPLYGTASNAETALTTVAIDNIPDRRGQELRLLLTDRFYGAGAPALNPAYTLSVAFTAAKQSLGIQRDNEATRARLTLAGDYTLTSRTTGSTILKGRERAFASYNILTAPYATIAAEDDAYARGLRDLADLITNRVALAVTHNGTP